MTSPAQSIRVFGAYLIVLALALLLAPGLVLAPFGMPIPTDVWIRVTGMLVALLGVYYLLAASAGLVAFFRWSVPVRLSVMAFFAAFVAFSLAPAALLIFAVVDAVGAAWTWLALRKSVQGA